MKKETQRKQLAHLDQEIHRINRSIRETKELVTKGELPSWRGDKHLRDLEFARKSYQDARTIWENLPVAEQEDDDA